MSNSYHIGHKIILCMSLSAVQHNQQMLMWKLSIAFMHAKDTRSQPQV